MKSILQNKLAIILLAALALGALTVLATSLGGVPFKEGQTYARNEPAESSPSPSLDITGFLADIPLWKLLVLWVLLAVMVTLLALLMSPEMRKKFIRMMFRALLTAIALYYVFNNYGDRLLGLQGLSAAPGDPLEAGAAQPRPEFQPPEVSPLTAYLISFAFALLAVVIAWILYQSWRKYLAANAGQPLHEIARIARSSLADLNAGRDSSDVIINCYLRMSDVVADKQQLHREIAMTPQEFAVRLERAGLPGDAVRRLTRLFEMVRYGDRKSAPRDVTEAVGCLNTILQYCGETV